MTTAKAKPDPVAIPAVDLPERITRIVEDRKVTFGYTRKRNLGNYENEEASFYVSEYVPTKDDLDTWLDAYAEAYDTTCKTQVWRALGLKWNVAEDGSVKLAEPPPVTETPEWQRQNAARRAGGGDGGGGQRRQPPSRTPPRGSDNPTMAQVGYYADAPQFCQKCGERDFYDNRTDNDDKIKGHRKVSPDWKCKNCGQGVWRPGSFDYNTTVGKPAPQMSPPGWPEPPDEDAPF